MINKQLVAEMRKYEINTKRNKYGFPYLKIFLAGMMTFTN